jgi:hypothetical protein
LRCQYSWAKQVRETSPKIVNPGRAKPEVGIDRDDRDDGIWARGVPARIPE